MNKVKQWMRMELVGKRWMPYILVTPLSFSSHANLSQMVWDMGQESWKSWTRDKIGTNWANGMWKELLMPSRKKVN